MNDITIFESELKIMEILWNEENPTAKEVSLQALKLYEWNKNTTYTVLKKLIIKKAVLREEPNFRCKALVTKEQIQRGEVRKLVDKLYDGSSKLLLSSFIQDEKISKDELKSLRDLINKKL